MHLYYNNVNDAFAGIVKGFTTSLFSDNRSWFGTPPQEAPISRSPSRYGEVLVINEPVTITYTNSMQRVLFNPYRNANPFFHLIESLWMLAGRNDVATLKHFISSFDKFSDDGTTIYDAYGYRWRHYFTEPPAPSDPSFDTLGFFFKVGDNIDQIEVAIKILRRERMGRRVVLQMWSPDDLLRVHTMPDCKAVPCNLCIMFLPRRKAVPVPPNYHVAASPGVTIECEDEYLDMTVINRSNDTLLGALGANYVHMSYLFEYTCLATDFKVGNYHHITNNLHVYTSPPLTPPSVEEHSPHPYTKEPVTERWTPPFNWSPDKLLAANTDEYIGHPYEHTPLWSGKSRTPGECRSIFDTEIAWLLDNIAHLTTTPQAFETTIINTLFLPAVQTFNLHKQGRWKEALGQAGSIVPMDWRIACTQWLKRRSTGPTMD